jgi:GT2 family glycosyltransferase
MLGAFNDAATAFEASVTNMYRAATFMSRIRASTAVDANFKDALGAKPDFVKRIGDIRKLRRAIHHLDEDIGRKVIPSGMPIYLLATGDIVRRDDGQEVKTIDRLQIGQQQIKIDAIAAWLFEMVQCAKRIEGYDWKNP